MIKLEEKLYTSTEVADILGVSLRSVYRYIEENKLNAEVKTATGRHRFTKQNIIDFLYPSGSEESARTLDENLPIRSADRRQVISEAEVPARSTKKTEIVEEDFEEPSEEEVVEQPVKKAQPSKAHVSHSETVAEEVAAEEDAEEAVDWLAKFRAAAKKFEEESIVDSSSAQDIYEEEQPSVQKFYYRSRLGGLKDIAQNIDKTSKNSGVDYAFTMNAGLSLYTPLKPFSMLHSYIRSNDKNFFERILMLTPSDENNAQLCLIVSDDQSLYEDRDELHGLFVVSKKKLLEDVGEFDGELLKEAEKILK